MKKVVVDIFGGDHAPDEIVKGCLIALENGKVPPVYLSGNIECGRDHNIVLENLFMGRVKHL